MLHKDNNLLDKVANIAELPSEINSLLFTVQFLKDDLPHSLENLLIISNTFWENADIMEVKDRKRFSNFFELLRQIICD